MVDVAADVADETDVAAVAQATLRDDSCDLATLEPSSRTSADSTGGVVLPDCCWLSLAVRRRWRFSYASFASKGDKSRLI